MKFADPSYTILKAYFDEILVTRDGTDHSYLMGPKSGLVSEGGTYTQLYELNPTQGFIGHNFQIISVTDNNFVFEYIGEISSNSLSQELEVNNEIYFRKDSFFHYWLNIYSDLYKDDVNVNKTFLYFGKIYPMPGVNNYYNIIFDGLKDFVYNALPENNRSTNIEEWIKVYWDESYHSIYNLMKTMWSMIDAKEVNFDFLSYIADAFGIAINEDLLTETELREWVQNIIYFLKRKGTFSSYFIIWKLLLGNVINQLNIYERWQEWCSTEITDMPDSWLIDHHYLEHYGVSPSGSSGDYFYSQYDSDDYPIHANIAPTGACVENIWNCSTPLDYTTFLDIDVGGKYIIYSDRIFIEEWEESNNIYMTISTSVSSADDVSYCVTTNLSSSASPSASVAIWGLSNEIDTFSNHTGNYLGVFFEYSDDIKFKIIEYYSGATYISTTTDSYIQEKDYYITITRNSISPSGSLVLQIYDRERRGDSDLIESINLTLHENLAYSQLYGLNFDELSVPSGASWTGDISELNTQSVSVETISPSTSGNYIITPHYRVEVDLTGQPLGDTYIITEDLINELIRYWEYTRPINKFVDYNYVLAPLTKMDCIGSVVSTYDSNYNGFLNTVFTGSYFSTAAALVEEGDGIYTERTYTHNQTVASKGWSIQHNLDTYDIIVQCFNADNELINPNDIRIWTQGYNEDGDLIQESSKNTISFSFNEAVRGKAFVAAVDYTQTIPPSADSNEWDITHGIGTSGTGNIAPIVQIWEYNDYMQPIAYNQYGPTEWGTFLYRDKFFASEMIDLNLDQFDADFGDYTLQTSAGVSATNYTYEVSAAGYAGVRRGSYVHTQSTPSNEWDVVHNLNALGLIVQVFAGNQTIKPEMIKINTFDESTITFSEAITGYAHLIKIPRTLYETTDPLDPTGLEIINKYGAQGYWEVGDGQLDGYDYTTNNRLINTIATGSVTSIVESGNYYYLDFTIPKGEELNIKEIGIFNYENNMMFYSFMSPMYKPSNVSIKIHYRIEKPGV